MLVFRISPTLTKKVAARDPGGTKHSQPDGRCWAVPGHVASEPTDLGLTPCPRSVSDPKWGAARSQGDAACNPACRAQHKASAQKTAAPSAIVSVSKEGCLDRKGIVGCSASVIWKPPPLGQRQCGGVLLAFDFSHRVRVARGSALVFSGTQASRQGREGSHRAFQMGRVWTPAPLC